MLPTRRGALHLFRLFGIDVFLHWSWFLVAIFEIGDRAKTYSSISWNVFEYLALFLIVLLHEFGHAFFCRKFGGEVHVMGIMLMIFTPMPYVDATSSWSFRERWKRVLVGAAGMIVEVVISAVAIYVWWITEPGLLHFLCLNLFRNKGPNLFFPPVLGA